MLQRSVDRGEIREDVNLEAAVHALMGSIFFRHLLGVPESEELIEQTVEILCRGIQYRRNP
jgi:hypothetical protein